MTGPDLDLDTLTLKAGSHDDPDVGMCVMEAVAFVAGERWSDHPECASKTIAEFLRTWNDGLDDESRQMLKRFIPLLPGTACPPEVEERQGWMAFDWLARTHAVAWLRLAKLDDHADALAGLPEITADTIDQAAPLLAAAGDAARDAARAAARDAAWAAAWAAARAAAWAAARDAARAALESTVKELQQSALDLVDRMIAAAKQAQP